MPGQASDLLREQFACAPPSGGGKTAAESRSQIASWLDKLSALSAEVSSLHRPSISPRVPPPPLPPPQARDISFFFSLSVAHHLPGAQFACIWLIALQVEEVERGSSSNELVEGEPPVSVASGGSEAPSVADEATNKAAAAVSVAPASKLEEDAEAWIDEP